MASSQSSPSRGRMDRFLDKFHRKPSKPKETPPTPPTPPPVDYARDEFLHVPLGSGGTFADPAQRLGTSACLNTVGVCFEVSASKAFCAHIDAFVIRPETPVDQGGATRKWYTTNFLSAPRIRQVVHKRLAQEIETGGWEADYDKQRMRDTLVLTCRVMHAPGGGTTQVSEVVAKAVMEWLEVEQKDAVVLKKGAAFVVEWPKRGVREFENEVVGLAAVDAEIEAGGWSFQVDEVDVEASERAW